MLTKKWAFVGIFTLLSLSLAMASPPAVHPTTGAPLVITCLKGTPEAIDGNLSDWNLDAMTPAVLDAAAQIYTGQASWTGPADCSGKFYLQWDDKKIYLAVVVKDDLISMNKSGVDIWNADAIEVFFSTTNAVAPHAEHYQFGFNANNQKFNWCNMDSAGQTIPDYLEVASSRTPDGYICEAAIEWGRIRNLNFKAGNTIGFHPVIDDTEVADREIQMTWTGREAHDQSLGFGYLILSAEPAIAKELGRGPSPADKAVDVPVDTLLAWTPGEFAASHDVYFGTAFADVNTATRTDAKGVLASKGQTAAEFRPTGLTYGQTYYWRVDEVNAAPDNTIFKGAVWSFTAESYGYPIQPVAATASSAQMNMGPDKTIDGSGLDKNGLHGTGGTTMWLSNMTGPTPAWIQYEFDKVYKLADMKVWNSNGQIEVFMGFGAKKVTIEYSTDGTTWKALDNVPEFARAPGQDSYAANTTVSFGGVEAKYVKLTISATWGGLAVAGLSEVRFSAVPVRAFGPQPAAAATGVSVDASLDWRPGREATSHKVFFGTDQAAVAGGTAAAQTVTGHSYSPSSLNFGTTYYWKVDEVGAATYPGDVWSFSTLEYAVVEDFESYTDKTGIEIFSTWIDGFTNGSNGSTIGYMTASNGTFGETIIVHGGRQSMPMEYNNVKTPYYSEAERAFDTTQNWTTNGTDTLSVYYRGRAAGLVDKGNNAFLTSAAGTDIWDVGDQFRFAYKQLSGNGSITMRVDSIGNTNVWAKAGPMIRENLETGSKNVYFAVTPGSGVSFQWRATASGASANSQTAALVAPYWVRITRTGNNFKAERSADGKTWTQQGTDTGILMTTNVYIGMAVTSHDAAQTTLAEISNVSTTGTVSGNWQVAAIGTAMPSNDPAPLYLTVEDKAGKKKTVVNANAAATTVAAWTEWRVPLADLSAGGVNLAAVKKITIGVGDKANPKAGGAGMLFIDDIGYGHPVK